MKIKKVIILSIFAKCYACSSENIFQCYDNNIGLSYGYAKNQDTSTFTLGGVTGEVLLDNNIWLNASMLGLITYNNVNNNRGFDITRNNSSGSSFVFKAGYGFNVARDYNFIPYLGLNYTNFLVSYNYNSINQFIIENPSYNALLGVVSEYNILDKVLKFRLDTMFTYSDHKMVAPNSSENINSLGHFDYSNYSMSFVPELQYNISSRLTISAYSSFSFTWGGNPTPDSIYYNDIGNTPSNLFSNDNSVWITGIKFGVLF